MRRLRRFLPSPAMVVALTALFMALGGSAYALVITGKSIRNGSVTRADIKNRSLTGSDIRSNSVGGGAIKESSLGLVPGASIAHGGQRYAVVTGAGVTARGRSVTSAARTAEGRYQVIFDTDIRTCAYFATIGDQGAAQPPQGEIAVSALASNVNGVAVRTENSNGAAANRPFHLIVSC
jgi:hypothetical protein